MIAAYLVTATSLPITNSGNFEGNLKCAGYDTIYYLKIANYEIVEYRESSGEFVLPSAAEMKDFKWI